MKRFFVNLILNRGVTLKILIPFILLLIAVSIFSRKPKNKNIEFLWRPESIISEIKIDDEYLKMGQYILLTQKLKEGEYGWTMSKKDIPESWEVTTMYFKSESLIIETIRDGKYYLSPSNYGKVSLKILESNGNDDTIQNIWNKYGKTE